MSDQLSKKPYLHELQPEKKRDEKKSKDYDEKQLILHMKEGWSRRQIQEVYRIGPTKYAEIRAKHKDELNGLANLDSNMAHQRKLEKRRQQY